jgi:hypothetical protein
MMTPPGPGLVIKWDEQAVQFHELKQGPPTAAHGRVSTNQGGHDRWNGSATRTERDRRGGGHRRGRPHGDGVHDDPPGPRRAAHDRRAVITLNRAGALAPAAPASTTPQIRNGARPPGGAPCHRQRQHQHQGLAHDPQHRPRQLCRRPEPRLRGVSAAQTTNRAASPVEIPPDLAVGTTGFEPATP